MAATSAGAISLDLNVKTDKAKSQIEAFSNTTQRNFSTLSRSLGQVFGSSTVGASRMFVNRLMNNFGALGSVISAAFAPLAVTPNASALEALNQKILSTGNEMSKLDDKWNLLDSKINEVVAVGKKQILDLDDLDAQVAKAEKSIADLQDQLRLPNIGEDELARIDKSLPYAEDVLKELEQARAQLEKEFEKSVAAEDELVDSLNNLSDQFNALKTEQDLAKESLSKLQSPMEVLKGKVLQVGAVLKNLMLVAGVALAALAALGIGMVVSMANAENSIPAVEGVKSAIETLKSTASATASLFQAVMASAFMGVAQTAINAANAILKAVNTILAGIGSLINSVTGGLFTKVLNQSVARQQQMAKSADGAAKSTGGLAGAQKGATKATKDQNKAQKELNKTLAGFDKINKLAANSTNLGASGGGGGGAGGLGGGAVLGGTADELKDLQSIFDRLQLPTSLLNAFEHLSNAVSTFAGIVKGALKWCWDNVLVPLGKWTLNELAPRLVEALASAFDVVNAVLEALSPIWNAFFNVVVKPFASLLGNVLLVAIEIVSQAFRDMAALINNVLVPIYKKVYGWVSDNLGPVFQGLSDLLSGVLWSAWKGINAQLQKFSVWLMKIDIQPLLDGLGWVGDKFEELIGWIGDLADWWDKLLIKLGLKQEPKSELIGIEAEWLANILEVGKTIVSESNPDISFSVGIKVKDETPEGVNSVQRSLKAVPIEKTTQLFSKDGVIGGINAANSTFGSKFTNRTAQLYSNNSVLGGINAANTTFGSKFTNRTAQLYSNNNVLGGINAAIKTLTQKFVNKTIQLYATDKASSVINNLNNKKLSNKSATISYTPVLTKKTISLKAGGGGKVTLQAFAQGGFVERNTPRLAIIGDNTKEGEIVSPESKFQSMLDKAAGLNTNNAETNNLLRELIQAVREQDGNIYLDGKTITRSVVNNINQQVQSTGRSPILV